MNNDEEEELLYGDLEETAQSIQAQELLDKLKIFQRKNQNLQTEVLEWKEQVNILLIEKKQVEDNMITLYNTALRELDRKDTEINELKVTISQLRNNHNHQHHHSHYNHHNKLNTNNNNNSNSGNSSNSNLHSNSVDIVQK